MLIMEQVAEKPRLKLAENFVTPSGVKFQLGGESTKRLISVADLRRFTTIRNQHLVSSGPSFRSTMIGDDWEIQLDLERIEERSEKQGIPLLAEVQKDLNRALTSRLIEEKIKNSGEARRWHVPAAAIQVGSLLLNARYLLFYDQEPLEAKFIRFALTQIGIQAITNIVVITLAYFGQDGSRFNRLGLNLPDGQTPMARNSLWELPLPIVPVDRLIRGWWFLRNHGDELLTTEPPKV